jgi:hypothetical protein
MLINNSVFKELLKYDSIFFLLNDNYINRKLVSSLYKDLYNYNNDIEYVSDIYSYRRKDEDKNIFFINNYINKSNYQFNVYKNDKFIIVGYDDNVLNNLLKTIDLVISSPFEDDFFILKDRYNFIYYNDFFKYLNSLRKNIIRQEKIKSLEIF